MSLRINEFNESNMKLMATALFFEYAVYSVFNIYDVIKKDHPEYVYLNDDAAKIAGQNNEAKKKNKEKKDNKKKTKGKNKE